MALQTAAKRHDSGLPMSRGGTEFPDIDQTEKALRYVNHVVCYSRRVDCWHPRCGVFRVYLYLDVLARFWRRGSLAKYLPCTTWMSPARWAGPLHEWQWHNHEDGNPFEEVVEKSRKTMCMTTRVINSHSAEGTMQCQSQA